jgi:DNA invertase Pin-like site-specific DNA recombinase
LDIQVQALIDAGVRPEHLYQETASGRKRDGRAALKEMLSRGIRKGDTVVCTRLDRLARSTRDLLQISETLESKGVDLKVLEQPIDTTSASGRLFFTVLGAFGEFEASIRAERQREGIDAAKAKGADSPFRGRPATIDAEKIKRLYDQGVGPSVIARQVGIARSSVYRYITGDNAGQAEDR